ncbi:toll/interleukin-1 receptor domain-containing protein [Allosphingosinicella deserti]|uniref:TIR domain-containing protein n=1 Tax=Allosphingosinicella deserti TaxID=2116704 RepID=A0A2P7QLS5_9SPHN|nr:toll/interleukin-1 receptor domain-containing protein [Sphingomonas deserti]PSJ38894.1 hypothetical protein C7I55_16365 [Sphingomonas deserti]
MVAGQEEGARYRAFLSYNHKDGQQARWLHRRLEGYRIPRRLAGKEGDRGIVPARLSPIFRDREELPAAGDLSEKVRAALAASQSLIVVCSPNAAASPWVAKEIDTFRELHPGRPILAAILDGEPAQCFPPPLGANGAEPLAADLRKQGDGRRLGLLKLVAGLAGTGLDALVQRDAQRRIRRVMAVTMGALMMMLVTTALAIFAFNARAEAERQRAEAEGLVEFMLTDLRRELREVGRLDIMATVNDRAMSFYRERERAAGSRGDLTNRARLNQTAGEDALTRGNLETALRFFRQAHTNSAAAMESAADDPGALFVHGRSEYWIGRVYELRQQWRLAEVHYRRFRVSTESLIASDPHNPEYMKQVAWAAIDLGNLQLNGARDAAAAQLSYREAVRWFTNAAQADRSDENTRLALANAYGWLAESYWAQDLRNDGLEARLRQHEIVSGLHEADSSSFEKLFRLAVADRGLARMLGNLGRAEEGRSFLSRAWARSGALTARDPSNSEWLLLRVFLACDIIFGKLGPPDNVSRAWVRSELRGAASTMRAQRNPRVAEFANCLNALGKGA